MDEMREKLEGLKELGDLVRSLGIQQHALNHFHMVQDHVQEPSKQARVKPDELRQLEARRPKTCLPEVLRLHRVWTGTLASVLLLPGPPCSRACAAINLSQRWTRLRMRCWAWRACCCPELETSAGRPRQPHLKGRLQQQQLSSSRLRVWRLQLLCRARAAAVDAWCLHAHGS